MRLWSRSVWLWMATALVAAAICTAASGQQAAEDDISALQSRLAELVEGQKYEEALPLALQYVNAAKTAFGETHAEYASALAKVGEIYYLQGRYVEAEEFQRSVLTIREKVLGTDDPEICTSLTSLASTLQAQGRNDETELLLKRALEIKERALGAEHPEVADSLFNLGGFYLATEHYTEAEHVYKRSADLREKAFGSDHADLAISLKLLGLVYNRQGRVAEAEAVMRRVLGIYEKVEEPDHENIADALNDLGDLYRSQQRLDDAERLYKRSLTILEKRFGAGTSTETLVIAKVANSLASIYVSWERYNEAEPLLRRSLDFYERAYGNDDLVVASQLDELAKVLVEQSRYDEAELRFRRGLAIREKGLGAEHPLIATSLFYLARLDLNRGKLGEAEQGLERALSIKQKTLGSDHLEATVTRQVLDLLKLLRGSSNMPDRATELMRAMSGDVAKLFGADHPVLLQVKLLLGAAFRFQGRFAEAESIFKEVLTAREKAFGLEHTQTAESLSHLGVLYYDRGRYAEAEPLLRRALEIIEKALGPGHLETASILDSLAFLHSAQGRYTFVEALLKRALAIRERVLGSEHYKTAESLSNLAWHFVGQGRYPETELLYKQAISIVERSVGPGHFWLAGQLHNLGLLYRYQRRYTEAEPLLKRALAIRQEALGIKNLATETTMSMLGLLYTDLGRFDTAESLLQSSLGIRERVLGADDPDTGLSLDNLAWHYLVAKKWSRSAEFYDRSIKVLLGHQLREASGGTLSVRADGTMGLVVHMGFLPNRYRFVNHARAAYWASKEAPNQAAELAARAFEVAQWALISSAGIAVSQMAARLASGKDKLAQVVRQQQDLLEEWRAVDQLLTANLISAIEKRNPSVESGLREQRGKLEVRHKQLSLSLARDFPEFDSFAYPVALSASDTQKYLRSDEVLIQFLFTEEEGFAWLVTKDELHWRRIPFPEREVDNIVFALRCGLDERGWGDDRWGRRCTQFAGMRLGRKGFPFNLMIAHSLYNMLLGPWDDLIKGKHLLIVPSGPLTSLPFQVLVTERPKEAAPVKTDGYRDVAWLVKRHALTVLPSASSLRALREFARASRATRDFFGVGDPVLSGAPNCPKTRIAWTCPGEEGQGLLSRITSRIPAWSKSGLVGLFRDGRVDLGAVRSLCPLPETALELRCVARSLGVRKSEIVLGRDATETAIKAKSEAGTLRRYRVVHFATHGLLAADTDAMLHARAEPALVLTPPPDTVDLTELQRDDGLLTASEIALLKLDADWVILSACNTAAGEKGNAEALSGMARAFFYAGARAVLVSHWPVYSSAAVELTTRTFAEMKADREIGRAEALRRAMVAVINKGGARAHPAYWAPFVVVGEGGR